MKLMRLSAVKNLCDPLVSQLLGEWVASSPLGYEATKVWARSTNVRAGARYKRALLAL